MHDQQHRQDRAGDIGAKRADIFQLVGGVNAFAGEDAGGVNVARRDRKDHDDRDPHRHHRHAKAERENQQGKRRHIFDAIAVGAHRLPQRAFRVALRLMLGVHDRAAQAADIEPQNKHQKSHQADRKKCDRHGLYFCLLKTAQAYSRGRENCAAIRDGTTVSIKLEPVLPPA